MLVGNIVLSDYPKKEDIVQELEHIKGQIASDLQDMEILIKVISDGNTYMNEDEVRSLMHSKVIPDALTYYHWGREKLYSLKDINDYLAEKKATK
jgi:hypothetical protein